MNHEARLRAQIASLDELRGIVTAMRSLAAAEVQNAERALPGIRRYAEILAETVAQARALVASPVGTPPPWGEASARLVVICSERGFVGTFNERLVERVAAEPEALAGHLWLVGARGVQLARTRHLEPEWTMAMPTHAAGVFQAARRLAAELESRFARGELSRVALVTTRRGTGETAELERRQLLPLELGPGSGLGSGPGPGPSTAEAQVPVHHLDPLELFAGVVGEHVAGQLVDALMESLASENATRLRAMEAARHHIEDELRALRERANRLRQEEITAELLDVITGADAVRGGGG